MSMRTLLRAAVAATILAASLPAAAAYPDRPIRLVVPFPPGGLVGGVGLALARKMSAALGEPVVIENRPGAAGTIAAGAVAKAPSDGYTILFGTSATHGIAKYMYKDLPYDPVEDFAPVAIIGNVTVGVFASEKSGIHSLDQMMSALQSKGRQIIYGSPGVGSVSHLAAELLELRTQVDMLHVPYPGTVPQMTNLVSGDTHLGFTGMGSGITYTKDGRVKLIAVASKSRSKTQPDVPALGEVIPGYDAPAWLGIFAPKGTPADVLDRLEKAVQLALADEELQGMMQTQGIDADPMSAGEFGEKVRREMPVWEEAVRVSGAAGKPR